MRFHKYHALGNDYLVTDLLYASGKYQAAIDRAQQLIAAQGKVTEPRLYKLIAYSYNELHDSVKALDYMKQYFKEQTDTGFVVPERDRGRLVAYYDGGLHSLGARWRALCSDMILRLWPTAPEPGTRYTTGTEACPPVISRSFCAWFAICSNAR